MIYRPLVLECVDPGFLRSVSRAGAPAHIAFLALVVMNLVGGFHALGTLLAVGIMMLPAVIARFWARDITTMILIAVVSGAISGYAGLLRLVPHRRAVRPGDHSGRGRALRGVGAVRARRRADPPAVSRPPSGSVRTAMLRFAFAALALLLSHAPAVAQEKLKVVATFSILADFVKNVGGDRVAVSALVGPNSDAHVYQPSPGDAKMLADAKVVVANGLGFEGWINRLVKASGHQGADDRRHQGHQAAQGGQTITVTATPIRMPGSRSRTRSSM